MSDTEESTALGVSKNYESVGIINPYFNDDASFLVLCMLARQPAIDISLPSMPGFQFPDISLPNLNMPTLDIPNFDFLQNIPNVGLGIGGILPAVDIGGLASGLSNIPNIPLPDIPNIPFPDIPNIPFTDIPDMPGIPIPDLDVGVDAVEQCCVGLLDVVEVLNAFL